MTNHQPTHALPQKTRRTKKIIALALTGLFAFTTTGVALTYYEINKGITSKNVAHLLGERPQKQAPTDDSQGSPVLKDPFGGEAYNLLVLGSDTRDGANNKFGDIEGMRSDTTMLVHVAANRKSASVISIPRDSWVDIPSCTLSDGTKTTPRTTKFNAAFSIGGIKGDITDAAACAIKTVESLTDVYIDGYVVVDFSGFKDIVDTVGGVPFTTDIDLISPKANLKLKAGSHVLNGKTALGVMRARSGTGLDGSDISRIDRQQELMIALLEKVMSSEVLLNPQKLFDVTTQTARSLTVSENMGSVTKLAGMAYSLREVPPHKIVFLTVPIKPHPDGANVLWRDDADVLWEHVRKDASTKIAKTPSGYGLHDAKRAEKPEK